MQYTTNYNLKNPEDNDVTSNEDFNENFDFVDAELKRVAEETESKLSKIEADEKYEEKAKLKEAAYKEISNVPTENSTKLITSGAVFIANNGKANLSHKHTKADITDFPTTLPADGGDADTVNGHTVNADVPSNAKFTDTVYTHPASHPASMITGLPTSLPANGGNAHTVDDLHFQVLTQAAYDALPTKDANTLYFTT